MKSGTIFGNSWQTWDHIRLRSTLLIELITAKAIQKVTVDGQLKNNKQTTGGLRTNVTKVILGLRKAQYGHTTESMIRGDVKYATRQRTPANDN